MENVKHLSFEEGEDGLLIMFVEFMDGKHYRFEGCYATAHTIGTAEAEPVKMEYRGVDGTDNRNEGE